MGKFIFAVITMALLSAQSCSYAVSEARVPKDNDQLVTMQLAGLTGNRSLIPNMIKMLQNPKDKADAYTPLHSLAQLGAVEALPAVEAQIGSKNLSVSSFAQVSKARLLAQNHNMDLSTGAVNVAGEIDEFYHLLNLTPRNINGVVSQYQTAKSPSWPLTGETAKAVPVEVFAMREIADMIYHRYNPQLIALPGVAALATSLDYPSALKMRLAPFSKEERISTMIDELAHKSKLTINDYFEIQLLADEGLAASPAIVVKLQQMDANRQQYKPMGYAALFDALEGIGDKDQIAALSSFQSDKTSEAGYYFGNDYFDLKDGLKRSFALGY